MLHNKDTQCHDVKHLKRGQRELQCQQFENTKSGPAVHGQTQHCDHSGSSGLELQM